MRIGIVFYQHLGLQYPKHGQEVVETLEKEAEYMKYIR